MVEGRRCLDAGASTGGFTDVLLRRGANEVVAVDVGYGQLVWRLQTDERVKLHDRTNVRTLTPEAIGGPVELIVADLSFISLALVLPALTACAAPGADLVPMVKPQFEVGRERLGAGGVVRDLGHRADAVAGVVRAAGLLGWGLTGVVASPLPGPSGNVEFFVHLRQDAPTDDGATGGGSAGDRRGCGEGWAMTDRRMLLVAHTGRSDISEIADTAAKKLTAAGIDLVSLSRESGELDLAVFDPTAIDESPIEIVLALGGDGTLLRAAEHARPLRAPVLGINLGRVGFLTEVDVDQLDEALDAIIDRRYRVSSRMTVEVTVEHDGNVIAVDWALNEISVEKGTRERILDVVVEVDGHGVSAYGCDGVLIATPTGSTAYTFSAGGPVLWPGVDALLIAPSNAHALFARSLVVAPESTVTVHINPDGPSAVLACDGRRIHEVPPGARVHVRKGEKPVTLVRLNDRPFTDRLVRKFKLPVHGWRDQRH